MTLRPLALAVAGGGLLLTGCGGSPSVSTDDLERRISSQIEETVGSAPDGVSCDEPLDAEVDATTTCVLTVGEEKYEVEATVSTVDGSEVELDLDVADAPMD